MSTRLTWSVLASHCQEVFYPPKKSPKSTGEGPYLPPFLLKSQGWETVTWRKRSGVRNNCRCCVLWDRDIFTNTHPSDFPKRWVDETSWGNFMVPHQKTDEWQWKTNHLKMYSLVIACFDVPLPCSFSGGKKKCGNIFREKKQTSPTTFRCNPVKSLEGSNLMQLYLEWMINSNLRKMLVSIKNWMGPYQRTPKQVTRVMRYSGLGVRSLGPVGDFLDGMVILKDFPLYGLVWYCHEVLTKPQNLKSLIFPYMNFWRGRSPI